MYNTQVLTSLSNSSRQRLENRVNISRFITIKRSKKRENMCNRIVELFLVIIHKPLHFAIQLLLYDVLYNNAAYFNIYTISYIGQPLIWVMCSGDGINCIYNNKYIFKLFIYKS